MASESDRNSDLKDAIQRLRQAGYKVRKAGPFVKTSFMVHEPTLHEFKRCVGETDCKVQEAVTEAFELWIESRKIRSDKSRQK